MTGDLEAMRKSYLRAGLRRSEVLDDPMQQFERWFEAARVASAPDWFEANAMTLSTADRHGRVTSRVMLLKGVQSAGFVFYTNYHSQKGGQLAENPFAALCFFWPHLERQVRIEGTVERVSAELSDKYFQARPRESQIGALLSQQSQPVANREALEARFEALDKEHQGQPITRPAHWGGYLLRPHRVEFWQGRPSRIHDRLCYSRNEQAQWMIARLCP